MERIGGRQDGTIGGREGEQVKLETVGGSRGYLATVSTKDEPLESIDESHHVTSTDV